MAAYLSKFDKSVKMAAVCLALVFHAGAAGAQVLTDPTKPPTALGTGPERSEKASGEPELQSVLISPARRVAIINGQSVQVGDRVGDARVARISENEVVLRTGPSLQVLKLFPQVEKYPAQGRSPGKTERKSQ